MEKLQRFGAGGNLRGVDPGELGLLPQGCPEFDLWTDHLALVQAMKKEVRKLTPRMQKFREAIQAYNVCMSFVKGIHNHISDALSRSQVGGPEGIERTLRIL